VKSPSRREFLGKLAPLGLAVLAGEAAVPTRPAGEAVARGKTSDEDILRQKVALADRESLRDRPVGEIVVAMGTSFIGTPYVAHTLEQPGEEHLVVNLRGLDCVTFVETTLALARCIKLGHADSASFRNQLQLIRYRGGKIDGYASRLHYFSDWIDDNEEKKVVRNMTATMGGAAYEKKITFMSSHPASYAPLANPDVLSGITAVESALNGRSHAYLQKSRLAGLEGTIEGGDILGITTSVEGLDIVHTGIAVRANGVLKYLHAPLSQGRVQITQKSLGEYLAMHPTQTGVMVARPVEPVP